MKFIINNNNYKQTIIFIHGFLKNYNDFNVTDHDKKILIEEHFRKKCNTIMVHIEKDDYIQDISITEQIYQTICNMDLKFKNITLVTHSLGSFNAIYLAEKYPKLFKKLLLIDPTIKSNAYHDYLVDQSKNQDIIVCIKLKNYDLLSNGKNLKSNIVIYINVNYDTKINKSNDDMILLHKFVSKNVKSRFILHVNKSHMLHYTNPNVIIDSIDNLNKL